MDYLTQYVKDKVDLSEEELGELALLFSKKSYKKGDELLSAGDTSSKFYYVSQGAMRTYSIDTTGHEQTWGLHVQNDKYVLDTFAGDFSHYYYKLESGIFIEAYTDSVIYEADFEALDNIYESSLNFMKLGLKIHQEQTALLVQRIKMFKNLTATEKYLMMKSVAPMYEEMLANYQFATVLDITPQSLSRIKKELLI